MKKVSNAYPWYNRDRLYKFSSYNLKVENLNSFTYKTLVKDLKIIEESFFEKLSVKCKINIMKNFEEIKKNKSNNEDKMIDGDHPLLMDVLDKFEGEILK